MKTFSTYISLAYILCVGAVSSVSGQIKIVSQDSMSTMRIRMGFQGRYEMYRPEVGPNTTKSTLERARFAVMGQAFRPGLDYFLQLSVEPSQRTLAATDPNKTLLDAWVQYRFSKYFGVRAGQFIMPALRQGFTSIMFQQFAERSQLAKTFTYNRDIGVMLFGEIDILGIIVKPKYVFTTGEGRAFTDIGLNTGNQHLFRMEVLTGGEYATLEGYSEGDLDREGHPKGSFGIGYEINNDPLRQRGNAGAFLLDPLGNPLGAQIKSLLIDGQIKYRGFSSIFEYINREVDVSSFLSGKGYNIQVGYLTISNLEIVLRYSKIDIDGLVDSSIERRLAINRYFNNHSMKLQGELGRTKTPIDGEVTTFRLQFSVFL